MGKTEDNLQRLISLMQRRGNGLLSVSVGTAKNVDEQKRTCEIEIDTDLTLLNCRLNAVVDSYQGNVLVIPKDGSKVAYIAIDGQLTDVLVIGYSDVDKVLVKVGESEVDIQEGNIVLNGGNGGKVSIKNNGQNLYSLLGEILDAINAMTVSTATGPSGTPINVAQFSAIKTRLGQLME